MKILNTFQELAGEINNSWRKLNYCRHDFPEVAAKILMDFKLQNLVGFDQIIELGLNGHISINYWQENSPFGDMQIIPYRDNNFFIEILVWNNGTTSIHDHAFSGAFTVLKGRSINSQYNFDVNQVVNNNFKVGRLHGKLFEILRPGDVRKIHAGRDLIHAVYHLEEPTVSIVVRTYQDEWVMPQLEYRGKVLAVNQDIKNDFLNKIKTLKVLDNIDQKKFAKASLSQIQKSNIDEKYWLVRALHDSLYKAGILEKCFNQEDRFILDVLKHEQVLQNFVLVKNKNEDWNFRYFIDLLMNIPDWMNIQSILEGDANISMLDFYGSIYENLHSKYGFKFLLSKEDLVHKWLHHDFKKIFKEFSNIDLVGNPFKEKILELG